MVNNHRTVGQLEQFLYSMSETESLRVRYFETTLKTLCTLNYPQPAEIGEIADVIKNMSIRDALIHAFSSSKPYRDAFFVWWNSNAETMKKLSEFDKAPLLCLLSAALLIDEQHGLAKDAAAKALEYDKTYTNLANLILTAINHDDKFMNNFSSRVFVDSITALTLDNILGLEKKEEEEHN
ncbi:hypothetical protein UFOVP621_94 [uncultured Caudovirales phage]|uniref:Uncharacterized protein n=1 Tax=uncultured Caudovirales phage TaxID=2100421 RepID=A0A6J5N3M0_9CAUD|nr:hypothetical protein UFOVP621_94 [uncultured Caudovirales phage]